jgi:hypothetical protein
VVFFFTDNNITPTIVILSYFGLLVGMWQQIGAELCKDPVQCSNILSRDLIPSDNMFHFNLNKHASTHYLFCLLHFQKLTIENFKGIFSVNYN